MSDNRKYLKALYFLSRGQCRYCEEETKELVAKYREESRLVIKELIEKNEPKKVKDVGYCPNCGKNLYKHGKYCHHCGQALDWDNKVEL